MSEDVVKKPAKRKSAKIAKIYEYEGPDRDQFFQVVVKSDGSRATRVRNPENPRILEWGMSRWGAKNTIYDYRRISAAAAAGRNIFICPDEDGVAAFTDLKVASTTCAGGFGKWEYRFCEYLKGARNVVIFAHNDPGPADGDPVESGWVSQRWAILLSRSFEAAGVKSFIFILPDVGGKACRSVPQWLASLDGVEGITAALRAAPPFPQAIRESMKPNPPESKRASNSKESKYNIDAGLPLASQIGAEIYAAGQTESGDERKLSTFERNKIKSEVIFEWLQARGVFYFHLEHLKYDYNMYFDSHEKELHVIESNYFSSWLAKCSGTNRTDRSFGFCTSYLHDQALCGDNAVGVIPEKFFCRRGDVVYLSNGDRHMVRVGAGGVEFVDNGTDGVVFAAGQTLCEWDLVDSASSVNPFEECLIFRTMPVEDVYGKVLTLLWILGVLYCHEKKPPIVMSGDVGSGKTRLAVGIFELLGISPRVNAIGDKSSAQDDFWVSINYPGLICWDNVDTNIRWLPDALASAATNGNREVREMYSNAGIYFHKANSNIMITSANATFAGDAGLADRLITVRLGRLMADTDDKLLSEDVDTKRSAALSWLCGVISKALADNKPVPKGLNRRHPDWAEFAVRCGRAMDQEDHVLAAIKSAECDKSKFAIENNWIGSILRDVLEPGILWKGTSTDLCALIAERGELNEKQQKDLSAKRMGNQLKLIWPHLEKVFGANKRIVTGKTVYELVGLVGSESVNQQTSSKSGHADFAINTSLNQPNPLSVGICKKEERIEEGGEIEKIDLDWIPVEDGEE